MLEAILIYLFCRLVSTYLQQSAEEFNESLFYDLMFITVLSIYYVNTGVDITLAQTIINEINVLIEHRLNGIVVEAEITSIEDKLFLYETRGYNQHLVVDGLKKFGLEFNDFGEIRTFIRHA